MTDWDPDGAYAVGVSVYGCELCTIGEQRTHAHYLYRAKWRALIDVQLPDQEPPTWNQST